MDDAELGDDRLTQRLRLLIDSLADRAGQSFPKALDNAELEGAYRFFGNAKVTPEAFLAPHFRESAKREARHKNVLVVHDASQFEFHGTLPHAVKTLWTSFASEKSKGYRTKRPVSLHGEGLVRFLDQDDLGVQLVPPSSRRYVVNMKRLKAQVRDGRLVLDEPTDLPEGAQVELLPVDWDDLDEEDRDRLHEALADSEDDLLQGRMRPAADVLADLERPSR